MTTYTISPKLISTVISHNNTICIQIYNCMQLWTTGQYQTQDPLESFSVVNNRHHQPSETVTQTNRPNSTFVQERGPMHTICQKYTLTSLSSLDFGSPKNISNTKFTVSKQATSAPQISIHGPHFTCPPCHFQISRATT